MMEIKISTYICIMSFQKTYTLAEAQRMLELFCAYQERSHQEVEQKLYKIGMVQEARNEIILHLLQHDFLNEERFAQAFARGKFRIKQWGKIKITQTLRQKGVSNANITIGLAEINDNDYLATLEKLLEVQFDKLQVQTDSNISFKTKQKVIRFLQQKGYELEVILKCINLSSI